MFLFVNMDSCEIVFLLIYLFFSLGLWFCFLFFGLLFYVVAILCWFVKHIEVTIVF
jgi:hypothetical protein